jgi:hypothetical protein
MKLLFVLATVLFVLPSFADESALLPRQYYELAHEMGAENELEQAFKYMQKAAENGHVPAYYYLGALYQMGQGIQQDSEKAMMWLQKARHSGDYKANIRLGYIYLDGTGTTKIDISKAIEYFYEAAIHGNTDAQYNLALIYSKEEEYTNAAKAFIWSYIATNGGDIKAREINHAWSEHLAKKSPEIVPELQKAAEDIMKMINNK